MPSILAISAPFIPGWSAGDGALRPFAPELVLMGTIVAILLTPFFTPRKSNIACAIVALGGIALALLASIVIGWSGVGIEGTLFRGLLVSDPVSVLWKVMLLLFVAGIIIMWFATTAATMHEGDGPEFFVLLVGATLGMCLMASTSNLLMLLIALEMASLPSYVLAGFRKTHRIGAEASLKYVLFGAATTSVMAYGVSMLYGLYGTLQLEQMAATLARSHSAPGGGALLAVAVFGLIIGIGSKISAVPFHFWCPDVFEGAGVDVSAFLSVASKGAALILLLRVLSIFAGALGYHGMPGVSLTALAAVVGTLGAITATVGNTAAFAQNSIKRLLAYSSIAHGGYMLCALSLLVRGSGTRTDLDLTAASAQAILLYLAVYLFMNLGAFTAAGLVDRQTGGDRLANFAGLGRRSPLLAISMTAFMLSLVGLPPLAGFNAKLNILIVLGSNGGWWWALVAVIGINTVLSLYYYLRVVRTMYFTESSEPSFSPNPIGLAITTLCASMLLLMFFAYGPLGNLMTAFGKVNLTSPPAATVATTR